MLANSILIPLIHFTTSPIRLTLPETETCFFCAWLSASNRNCKPAGFNNPGFVGSNHGKLTRLQVQIPQSFDSPGFR
jgi:hypothetical protein